MKLVLKKGSIFDIKRKTHLRKQYTGKVGKPTALTLDEEFLIVHAMPYT